MHIECLIRLILLHLFDNLLIVDELKYILATRLKEWGYHHKNCLPCLYKIVRQHHRGIFFFIVGIFWIFLELFPCLLQQVL